jgi:hypothetical protein
LYWRRAGIGVAATLRDPVLDKSCTVPVLAHSHPALLVPAASGVLSAFAGPLGATVNARPISWRAALSGSSPPWLLPLGATDISPAFKGRHRGRHLLGQYYCPNAPCQILHRHTRLVHAGIGWTFRFVAAAPSYQARRGPRAGRGRNAVAPFAVGQISWPVNRLTVVAGKSRRPRVAGYGAEK